MRPMIAMMLLLGSPAFAGDDLPESDGPTTGKTGAPDTETDAETTKPTIPPFEPAPLTTSHQFRAEDLPVAVSTAITKQYPSGTIQTATQTGHTYGATVLVDGKPLTLSYDASGKLLETGSVIAVTDAPKPVQTAISTKYAKWTVAEIESAVTPTKTTYETTLKQGAKEMHVEFDAKGSVIREHNPDTDKTAPAESMPNDTEPTDTKPTNPTEPPR